MDTPLSTFEQLTCNGCGFRGAACTCKPRRGDDWILTSTSRQFWPLDPRAEDVHIEDIAHHQSMQCRFTGACRFHYSVAQHSFLASMLAPAGEEPLWGLLHDAAEGYLVDIPRPLKHTPEFAAYRAAEKRLMDVICDRYGLPREQPAWVEQADITMLATEWRDVMPPQPHPWSPNDVMSKAPAPMSLSILPWQPLQAKMRFLARFHELIRGRR